MEVVSIGTLKTSRLFCFNTIKIVGSLSYFGNLLFYIFIFSKTFFGKLKMDKKNVQNSKMEIHLGI